MIGRKTMQSLIRYAETYYDDGTFDLGTDAKVKAAVAAIKAELCGGDYHDASGWKTSAHTNISGRQPMETK